MKLHCCGGRYASSGREITRNLCAWPWLKSQGYWNPRIGRYVYSVGQGGNDGARRVESEFPRGNPMILFFVPRTSVQYDNL